MKNLFKRFTDWIGLAGVTEEEQTVQCRDGRDWVAESLGGADRKPSQAEIIEAYFKSFTFSQGRWHVGNHQLWEGFTERDARAVSIQLPVVPLLGSSAGDAENFKWVLAVGGVVPNRGFPFERRYETTHNFIEQLKIEYNKNTIKWVLAAGGVVLNKGVPFERRYETMLNFIEQLKIEYNKNINIVMAASVSRLSSGDME